MASLQEHTCVCSSVEHIVQHGTVVQVETVGNISKAIRATGQGLSSNCETHLHTSLEIDCYAPMWLLHHTHLHIHAHCTTDSIKVVLFIVTRMHMHAHSDCDGLFASSYYMHVQTIISQGYKVFCGCEKVNRTMAHVHMYMLVGIGEL